MKKHLLFVIGTLLAISAYGQSKLPPCRGSDTTKWNSCFGTGAYANGNYFGEYKDGQRNGPGTYSSADGMSILGQCTYGLPRGREIETNVDAKLTNSNKNGERKTERSKVIDLSMNLISIYATKVPNKPMQRTAN